MNATTIPPLRGHIASENRERIDPVAVRILGRPEES